MFVVNVNSDQTVVFANKLEKLSSTALPNVVRQTLNGLAVDVKKKTLPITSKRSFTIRNQTFFKRFSRVNFVQERRNVNAMRSEIGMVQSGLFGSSGQAVDDLEKQEFGGRISGRSLIATDAARTGKSRSRLVQKRNRISSLKKVNGSKSLTKGQWIKTAMKVGRGGLIFGTFKPLIFRVDSITKRGGKTKIKVTPIYDVKPGRSINVKPTGFMKQAAMMSSKTGSNKFVELARKRFEAQLR